MVTPLGFTLAALFIGLILVRSDGLLWCVIIAVPFNDSAMIVAGGVAVSPYYTILILVVVAQVSHQLRSSERLATSARLRQILPLGAMAVLFTYTVAVTLLSSKMFPEVRVFAPGIGLDEQVGTLALPAFTSSNVAQLAYLLLNLNLVVYLVRVTKDPIKLIWIPLSISMILAGTNLVAFFAGIEWPHYFFDNSPRNFYALVDNPYGFRLRAHTSEPSHLGFQATVAMAVAISMVARSRALTSKRSRRNAAAVATVSALVTFFSVSGTALLTIAVMLALAVLAGLAKLIQLKKIAVRSMLSSLVFLSLAVVSAPILVSLFTTFISTKSESGSAATRSSADLNALAIFRDTATLGIGLGTNRTSSLVALLVSTIGLVGTLAFAYIVVLGLRRVSTKRPLRPLLWGTLTLVIGESISVADFSSPYLWVALGACFASANVLPDEADSRQTTNAMSTVGAPRMEVADDSTSTSGK